MPGPGQAGTVGPVVPGSDGSVPGGSHRPGMAPVGPGGPAQPGGPAGLGAVGPGGSVESVDPAVPGGGVPGGPPGRFQGPAGVPGWGAAGPGGAAPGRSGSGVMGVDDAESMSTTARDRALDLQASGSGVASVAERRSERPVGVASVDGGDRPASAVSGPGGSNGSGPAVPVESTGIPSGHGARSSLGDHRRLLLVLAAVLTMVAAGLVIYGAGSREPAAETASTGSSAVSGTSATVNEPVALQQELDGLVAATPLVFEPAASQLPADAGSVLAALAETLSSFPDLRVTIVGHGDGGRLSDLEGVGVLRAEQVRDALVAAGVPSGRLSVSGWAAVDAPAPAGDGGHIGFAVDGADVADDDRLRLAMVSPFASDERADTQAMVDTIGTIDAGWGDVDVAISTGVPDPAQLSDLVAGYADDGIQLVVLHGVVLDDQLLSVITGHPDTAFLIGPGPDPRAVMPRNLYAYDVASEEEGYVLGALAAHLTASRTVSVIGGVSGVDQAYVDAFHDGVHAEAADVVVSVEYTGSDDPALAAELARQLLAQGSDVLTGIGPVSLASEEVNRAGALWLAPASDSGAGAGQVAATSTYHWEVVVAAVLADLEDGGPDGRTLELNLANGGMVMSYSEASVPAEAMARAEEVALAISQGTIPLD